MSSGLRFSAGKGIHKLFSAEKGRGNKNLFVRFVSSGNWGSLWEFMNKVSSNHTGSTHETRLQAQSPINDLTVVYFILALLTGSVSITVFATSLPWANTGGPLLPELPNQPPKHRSQYCPWEWQRMQLFQMGERWWGNTITQLACYKRLSFRYKEISDLFQTAHFCQVLNFPR